jgi:hypothetical protein
MRYAMLSARDRRTLRERRATKLATIGVTSFGRKLRRS